MSLTSLVDVIFLLVLFFMLSSTFSRFSEVEIGTAARGATTQSSQTRPLFLRMRDQGLSLNGEPVVIETLRETVQAKSTGTPGTQILISLGPAVTAQQLTDILVILRAVPGVQPIVLGN